MGFSDELDDVLSIKFNSELENRAYNLGRVHAIVGDDVKSVDYLSDEEIIKLIKN